MLSGSWFIPVFLKPLLWLQRIPSLVAYFCHFQAGCFFALYITENWKNNKQMNPRYVTRYSWCQVIKLHSSVFGKTRLFSIYLFWYRERGSLLMAMIQFFGSLSGSIWRHFGDSLIQDPFCLPSHLLCSWSTKLRVVNPQALTCVLPFVLGVLWVFPEDLLVEEMRGKGRNVDLSSALTVE